MRKPERNAPGHCGNGKKYKKCCLERDENERRLLEKPVREEDQEVETECDGVIEDIEGYRSSRGAGHPFGINRIESQGGLS